MPTHTARASDTRVPPSETPFPTDTPWPTEPPTRVPTDTQPPPTRTPTAAVSVGLKVRIRNRTGFTANLYRIGTSGETHFLGWLGTGYYGIYPWPSLGTWTVEYCRRSAEDGSSSDCGRTTINVTQSDQEFSVP
jgi:hypothetical protein